MRVLLAQFFRFLFRVPFFKSKFYGLHKRVFQPYNVFRGVVRTIDYNGFQLKLNLTDWIQESIYFLGAYEKAELSVLEGFLKEDSVFLDLGANIGLYSLTASKTIGKNGAIIGFEPFSINYNAFTKHLEMNSIQNVKAEKMAVGAENGSITLYYDEKEANLGMVSTKKINNAHQEDVTMVAIDYYVKKHQLTKVDIIKIDIEGFEFPTLLGMEKTLRKFHPTILIELLDDPTTSSEKAAAFLTELGYKKHFITDQGTLSNSETNPNRRNYLFRF